MQRRKNVKRINKTAIFIITLLMLALMSNRCATRLELVPVQYTVVKGDTLDGLYYKYGAGNLEKWRYDVKRLNNMEYSGLHIGESIVILAQKKEN